MKHCLHIHQDYQPSNFLYICWMKYLMNRPIFHKFYMAIPVLKPCQMYFIRTFQLTTFVGQLMISMTHPVIYK